MVGSSASSEIEMLWNNFRNLKCLTKSSLKKAHKAQNSFFVFLVPLGGCFIFGNLVDSTWRGA